MKRWPVSSDGPLGRSSIVFKEPNWAFPNAVADFAGPFPLYPLDGRYHHVPDSNAQRVFTTVVVVVQTFVSRAAGGYRSHWCEQLSQGHDESARVESDYPNHSTATADVTSQPAAAAAAAALHANLLASFRSWWIRNRKPFSLNPGWGAVVSFRSFTKYVLEYFYFERLNWIRIIKSTFLCDNPNLCVHRQSMICQLWAHWYTLKMLSKLKKSLMMNKVVLWVH